MVVTGAGSGIGRATAHCLASAGACVLATDRGSGAARVTMVMGEGHLHAAQVDVSNQDSGR